jgi:hypothetical protein
MTPKPETWNIVLAGLWNRAIFSPEWVSRLLFHEPEVETLISVMPVFPIVYRNRQVAMEVAFSRLVFKPREMNDACIVAAEAMAHIVLNTLRDTPLLGVGINYAFIELNPRRDIVEMFELADDPSFSDDNWRIKGRRIVRTLERGMDTLNLALGFDGQELTIEFNFHTETTDNEASREAVHNRAIRLRNDALRLLDQTYHLQLNDGDDDE